MRNRNTLEFLGIWEQIHNPNFKGGEFETFKTQSGLNSFHLTPRKWIDATSAVGMQRLNQIAIRQMETLTAASAKPLIENKSGKNRKTFR